MFRASSFSRTSHIPRLLMFKSYTTAMIVSSLEFWLKFGFLQIFGGSVVILPLSLRWVGLFLVLTGQAIRSIAMVTCGSSFNHLIQRVSEHIRIRHFSMILSNPAAILIEKERRPRACHAWRLFNISTSFVCWLVLLEHRDTACVPQPIFDTSICLCFMVLLQTTYTL